MSSNLENPIWVDDNGVERFVQLVTLIDASGNKIKADQATGALKIYKQ